MNLFGYEIRRHQAEEKAPQFETTLQRLIAAQQGRLESVTPENCEQSPTVRAIVAAIANRLSVTPVHVYRRAVVDGRETKEKLPNHPVARLLEYPNTYQTRTNFWADAASSLVRFGNFYAYKGRGSTGPIRFLEPMPASAVTVAQAENGTLLYKYASAGGMKEFTSAQVLHVRGKARDFVTGDSPVTDVSTAIALEIAAERYGLSFFQNGALPLMVFRFMQGTKGFKTSEQEQQFIEDFQSALGGNKRHRAMLLPQGIETGDPIRVENDKAQMIESRGYQRTVICGAFGVPPQYVGDLSRGTWNNVEQQSLQFTSDVIYPVVQQFEAALERDLLTEEDWRSGVVIRFNLDSILRADFKSRQEGLQIQRLNGVLSANEWREIEGKNPLPEDKGGEDYLMPANMMVAGEEPEQPPAPTAAAPEPDDEDEDEEDVKQHITNISIPVSFHTGDTVVDVKGGETSVQHSTPETNINVEAAEAPVVHMKPPDVNVTMPDVKIYTPTPEVHIRNELPASVINVEAPEVKVDNHVGVPQVSVEAPNVTVEALMPPAQVEVQTVTVKAPDVTVVNEIPEYEQVESEAVRDKTGRILKTITTKRRRK